MRIGFNGLFLGRDATGSGQYARHLLQALLELDEGSEFWVFKPQERKTSGELDSGSDTAAPVRHVATLTGGRWRNLDKLWFEQVAFGRACRRARVDLCHVPYFASPVLSKVPTIVTIHDLIPLLLSEYRSSLAVKLYTLLVSAAARRADLIITDSQHSKQDIVAHLGIDRDRVRAIYLAAAPSCGVISDAAMLAHARQQYGLPKRYILYLGGFDRRKNLEVLLRAYARLLAMLDDAPPLVVAGRLPNEDTALFPNPRRMARELAVDARVIFTGWVAEEDKAALYSGALFFAFLSIYEGFGLMPLEAMACGTPVLAARAASLPEIVGPGGVLVDPTDVDEVAQKMAALVRDAEGRERLAAEALKQAARFDWKQTAEATLRAYRSVLECRGVR